jgi:hypothetical protein
MLLRIATALCLLLGSVSPLLAPSAALAKGKHHAHKRKHHAPKRKHSTSGYTTPNEVFYPAAIAVDPVSDTAYVAGGDEAVAGIWTLNGQTNTLEGLSASSPVTISFSDPPASLTENPTTGKLYVTVGDAKGTEVSVVPRGSNSIAETITIPGSNEPGSFGIAADSATDSIFVDNASETAGCPGFVADLDGATNRVVADVYGLANPGPLAVDTATDTVYVINGGDVDSFHGGSSNKQKSCGTAGITLGG